MLLNGQVDAVLILMNGINIVNKHILQILESSRREILHRYQLHPYLIMIF